MAGAAKDREIILQMAGAGIMVTLCGVRVEGAKWKFFLDRDEGTMADFLDEEDADLLPKLRTKSEYVEEFVSSEGSGFGYSAFKMRTHTILLVEAWGAEQTRRLKLQRNGNRT